MKKFLTILGVMFLCGCHARYSDGGHSRRGLFNFHITSNPSGAVIEQEGEYLGKTPLDVEIRTVCPPFVSLCRPVRFTAIFNKTSFNKTVRLSGKRFGDINVHFELEKE